MTTPLETVNAFLVAAAARDYDTALPLLTDDIEYQNMPIAPVKGREAVKEQLEMLLAMGTGSEWKVLREVADGDTVMNERVDRFQINGAWADLPVMGVFVLRDGLIAEWRDYFDLQTIMGQLAPPA
jgi:limonene-1,2-epoxide hydrolase